MKSQTHELNGGLTSLAQLQVRKRILACGPVDYKNSCAASGQSCQRQTMQEDGAGAQLAHTQLFTVDNRYTAGSELNQPPTPTARITFFLVGDAAELVSCWMHWTFS